MIALYLPRGSLVVALLFTASIVPAFVGTQLLVLLLFVGLGRAAVRGFRVEGAAAAT